MIHQQCQVSNNTRTAETLKYKYSALSVLSFSLTISFFFDLERVENSSTDVITVGLLLPSSQYSGGEGGDL